MFAFADAADSWNAHFETEPGVVTAHAAVNCMCLTLLTPPCFARTYRRDLCCCFLVHTFLKGPQQSTFKQNTFPPSRAGMLIYFYRRLLSPPSRAR